MQRTNKIVFFVKPIRIAEDLVATELTSFVEIPCPRNGCPSICWDIDASELEHGGREVDETDKTRDAIAKVAIDEVFEVLRDSNDQRHVQS